MKELTVSASSSTHKEARELEQGATGSYMYMSGEKAGKPRLPCTTRSMEGGRVFTSSGLS